MEILKTGFEVTVIGMGVVFLVLIFLSLTLKLFELLFYKKQAGPADPRAKDNQTSPGVQLTAGSGESPGEIESSQQDQQIAVLVCSVMAVFLDKDEYVCNIRQL